MPKKVIFDKKIALVLGGAGFIGSNLCDELIKTRKVVCIDNFSSSDEKNIDHLLSEPDFEFVNHDMTEPLDLDNLPGLQKFKIKFQGIQEIYNLACPMSVKNFEANKLAIVDANSVVVKNALELAKSYDAKLLHVSSSVVYGQNGKTETKLSESDFENIDFLSGRSSYDEGKRFAETMVMNYRESLGIDAKIIRLFRVYGPRMPLGDMQMIPDFINDALDNKTLKIFGDENFTSSFCYISDCIDAFIKMMESPEVGPINIGSDMKVKLLDVANKIIQLLDSKSDTQFEKSLEFMTPLNLPEIGLAKEKLSWLPIIPLEKGLKDTVHHIRANKGVKNMNSSFTNIVDLESEKD